MSDFDLIPADYRKQMQLTTAARLLVLVTAGALLLLLAAFITLRLNNAGLRTEIETLQQKQIKLNADMLQLAQLESQATALNNSTRTLLSLRGGGAAPELLTNLDRALVAGTVQLLDLRFERPPVGDDTAPSRLSLEGEALSHAALSRFVAGLQSQPGFKDIRLMKAEFDQTDERELLRFIIVLSVTSPAPGDAR